MRRGFLGGTFNPPHWGHVRAARAAAEQLGLEQLIIIPAGIPPHKTLPAGSADARQRLEMVRLAFGDIPGVRVLDWELVRPGRSYTCDTVAQLLDEDPEGELWLLCGTDMFETLPEWRRGDWLMQVLSVAAYPRKSGEENALRARAEDYRREYGTQVAVVDVPPLEISSTALREKLSRGEGSADVPESVYAFILKHRLYGVQPQPEALMDLARPWYKESRIPHVLGCRETAVELARRWGADVPEAERAAILHDITKKLPMEEQLHICEKRGTIIPNFRPEYEAMLHAFSGADAAALEFGVSAAVESAIRWHTTGRADMSLLEKIIWLADYIEPNRRTPGVDEVRMEAFRDLDKALEMALEHSLQYMEQMGFAPHPATREALAFLKGDHI